MKIAISFLFSVIAMSATSYAYHEETNHPMENIIDNAPTGVYVTTDFDNPIYNGLILACDGGTPENEQQTWCRIFDTVANNSPAQVEGDSKITLNIEGKVIEIGMAQEEYGLTLNSNQSGRFVRLENKKNMIVETSPVWSFFWENIDPNVNFALPTIRGSNSFRLIVQDAGKDLMTIKAENGTFQY